MAETTRKTAAPRKRAARKPVTPPAAPKTAPAVDPFTAPPVAQEESVPVSDETTEKKTRKPDPLLAAKRRLEKAIKEQAKAQKKADAVTDVREALDAANTELAAAREEFNSAVANVTGGASSSDDDGGDE